MEKWVALAVMGVLLAGCASGGREAACEVFSPAQIDTPTTQDDQRVEQSSGEPTGPAAEQRC
ncbi:MULTISPECIES: hypothetical protein [Pseudomonadaceae]|jgi:uncharacterized protein YcfL|uniref:Lipoprotein n=1 Tax=Ectopseudomonas hydrolytica TaxID=2493633 RepID=A0ABY5A9U4_9GAMM|nr:MULTISPECIES: hypothetical protein [Pseudomonas]ARS47302.1 hypothetical protein PSMEN_02505 [Pseudomonas mendocina]ATH83974.1 hypothetical protein CO724_23370 [Pseudomonas mendocina]MBA4246217.1 hypothetical protein [Pseudomonas sp.]MBF8160078.1 hypothetical protein [Pseudomonas mendocina]MDH0098799.1 hypothetical protein [Pseudomonas sp. GD04158]